MDLEHLHLFVEVMRRGSFAAAARGRNLDPSAVSRVITALEAELATRLFHRTTRKLSPTEAGTRYFGQIEPLLDELATANIAAADTSRTPRGKLRVAAPVSFALLNVVPLLPQLTAEYPELTFDLLLSDDPLDLIAERIDVAIRLGPLMVSDLVAQRLAPMVSRLCASPAYLSSRGMPEHPRDLAKHNCLSLKMPGFGRTWHFTAPDGTRSAIEVSGALESSNAIALKQCALAGMGIILQATWIVEPELQAGTLIPLLPAYQTTAASFPNPAIWVLYPSRSYVPEKVRLFLAFLRSNLPAISTATGS